MGDRDDRYNASRKGRARDQRREQATDRKAYKAKWARDYYRRKRAAAKSRKAS